MTNLRFHEWERNICTIEHARLVRDLILEDLEVLVWRVDEAFQGTTAWRESSNSSREQKVFHLGVVGIAAPPFLAEFNMFNYICMPHP